MHKFVALAVSILFASIAAAEDNAPIQMDTIECQHLMALGEEELSFLLAWLDGYFNHMHGTAKLSDASLSALGLMVQNGCAANEPNARVLDILNERIRQDALNQHP